MNPVLDTLQDYLADGCYIAPQDGLWYLFDRHGNSIASGASVRGMLTRLPDPAEASPTDNREPEFPS